jgi:hypothetical protein
MLKLFSPPERAYFSFVPKYCVRDTRADLVDLCIEITSKIYEKGLFS